MKKDEIIILENRGIISITGEDVKEFLQNIITNDIEKVEKNNTIFSALLSPQGKYLYEFFIIHSNGGYFLDCSKKSKEDLIALLAKYKLRSKVEISLQANFLSFVIFQELGLIKDELTYIYNDPRHHKIGLRLYINKDSINLINGPPTKKTIIIDDITERPVLKVK